MIHSTPPGINARYVMTDGHNYALRRCVGAAAYRARSTELRNMRVFHSHSHCAAIKRCLRCKNGTSRHKKKNPHPQPAAATYIFQFLLQAFFRAEK